MKAKLFFTLLFGMFCIVNLTFAATYYVNAANSTPQAPYDTWEKAANEIQAAVDIAVAGDTVMVTDGVYNVGERITPDYDLSNRVVILQDITVRSVNGAKGTLIVGACSEGNSNGVAAIRCVYMTNGILMGFTLTNGYTLDSGWTAEELSGGGVRLKGDSVVNNCLITANNCHTYGAGVYSPQGGTVFNCVIVGNNAGDRGGGVLIHENTVVSNCYIYYNISNRGGGVYMSSSNNLISRCFIYDNTASSRGGGLYCEYGGSIQYCDIYNNYSEEDGGGVYIWLGGYLYNCKISGNISGNLGGGVYLYGDGALTNCLINGNSALSGGGVYLENGGKVYSCTIASNSANNTCGGILFTNGGYILDSIFYGNSDLSGNPNWLSYKSPPDIVFCCTTPTNGLPIVSGNIPDDPLFVDPGSDYHLQAGSPCIDNGVNLLWMLDATDLDGNERIYEGMVDMGCYEFVPEPSVFYAITGYFLLVIGILRKCGYKI